MPAPSGDQAIGRMRCCCANAEAVALAWLLAPPAGILPVVGTQRLDRIARLAEAWRTVIDRETWFELWTLAAGQEVP